MTVRAHSVTLLALDGASGGKMAHNSARGWSPLSQGASPTRKRWENGRELPAGTAGRITSMQPSRAADYSPIRVTTDRGLPITASEPHDAPLDGPRTQQAGRPEVPDCLQVGSPLADAFHRHGESGEPQCPLRSWLSIGQL